MNPWLYLAAVVGAHVIYFVYAAALDRMMARMSPRKWKRK